MKYLLLLPGLWKRHKRKYNNRFFQSIKHLPAFQKTLIHKLSFLGLDLSPFANLIQKNNDLLWSRKLWGSHFERKLLRKSPSNLLGEKEQHPNPLKSQPGLNSCTAFHVRTAAWSCAVLWSEASPWVAYWAKVDPAKHSCFLHHSKTYIFNFNTIRLKANT